MEELFEKINILPEVVQKLHGKRILITGATGLIGSYLVKYLVFLNSNYNLSLRLHVICRSEEVGVSLFKQEIDTNLVVLHIHDVTQEVDYDIDIDYIIHLASPSDPLSFSKFPVNTMLANFIGTLNMLTLLKRNEHGRFLYISTGEVYGQMTHEFPKTEDMAGYIDTMDPRSCYPISKRAGESLCSSYKKQYNIDCVLARLCYVYGPTITPSNSRADAQFLRDVCFRSSLVLKSQGLQKRSYCFVGDVVSALLTILILGNSGEVYNVADPSSVITIRDYAEILSRISGIPIEFQVPSQEEISSFSKVQNAVLSPEKLLSLGWQPAITIKDGLEHTFFQYKRRVIAC